ncbi:MAG: hypothetical protein DMG22_02960 [Acidobacteria bacterium]|nr:MAG: hypothetical protein DMG22_02960 [Acidobacteriota bacterium]
MKRKASSSHDEAIVRRLRKDWDFAAEYLKAALEDKAIGLRLTVEAAQYITAEGLAQETGKRGSDGDTWTGRI